MASRDPFYYLLIIKGAQQGAHFSLDPATVTRIGRDTECQVALADPLCSRVHAEIWNEGRSWWVRDLASRNGTYLDDKRIDQAPLTRGGLLRVGNTELTMQSSEEPLTRPWESDPAGTRSITRQPPIDAGLADSAVMATAGQSGSAHDLLMLYQLSLKLLNCRQPDAAVELAMELASQRTDASAVIFYWLHERGRVVSRRVLPEGARSDELDQRIAQQSIQAVQPCWASRQVKLAPGGDRIAIPLVYQSRSLGALVGRRDEGEFSDEEFDFLRSTALLMCAAIARTRQFAALAADRQWLLAGVGGVDELIGDSSSMRALKASIAEIAPTHEPVLILGPTGTGKELVARAIHRASSRADRPLLVANCAGMPEELMEGQLFGIARQIDGSSDRDYPGWVQRSDTGTLLLDQIEYLSRPAQAKLVRLIQGFPFQPVGTGEQVSVDVRVLATSSGGLSDRVERGEFRADLAQALQANALTVPPLADRQSDVELLVAFYLEHYRKHHGRPRLTLSDEARQALLGYDWPGNDRQLRNAIDSAVTIARGNTIELADLLIPGNVPPRDWPQTLALQQWEKYLIQKALQEAEGKVPDAAELLGIGRATLYRKIDEYGIPRETS